MEQIESLQRLAEQFGRLQGVGKKSAMRMAFATLSLDADAAEEFANAIIEANRESLIDLIKPYQDPGAHSRATKKVKYFIGLLYPELTNVNWEHEVAKLLSV